MKTCRLFAALLVVALLTPLAFPQESSELTSLLAKARRGNGIAQYNVGLAYLEGKGTPADPLEAFVWLSLARENGARGRALDNLTGSLDRSTLEVAQRRLTERKAELGVRAPVAAPVTVRPETAALSSAAAPTAAQKNAQPAAPDNTALEQKSRELQAAVTELEAARAFGHQVEDTLNKVNDDRARVTAAAAAELEAARAFGQQVESTLNRVTDQKTALEAALRAAESARDGYAREFEASKTRLAAVEARARDEAAKPPAPTS